MASFFFYGNYLIKQIWLDLGIERKLENIQKRLKPKRPLNRAIFFLVFAKLLFPSESLEQVRKSSQSFVDNPASDLTDLDLHSCFDELSLYKDQLLTAINKSLDASFGKDRTERIYFEVITTDFLADRPASPEKTKESAAEAPKTVLEHYRKAEPVSVGLVFDKNGIPMDFEIYLGELSEFEAFKKIVKELKRKYKIKQAVRIINPLLKSAKPNLRQLQKNGYGFIATQRFSHLDPELIKQLHDHEGYKQVDPTFPEEGKFKVITDWERPEEKGQDSVSCHLVSVFTLTGRKLVLEMLKGKLAREEDEKKKALLTEAIKTLSTTNENTPERLKKAREEKWNASNFRSIAFDFGRLGRSGEKDGTQDTAEVDAEAIQAIRTYRVMNQMRDFFRKVMKDPPFSLNWDQAFQDRQDHFFVCFLALLVLRTMQYKLRLDGALRSLRRIWETIKNAQIAIVNPEKEKKGEVQPERIIILTRSSTPEGLQWASQEQLDELYDTGIVSPNEIDSLTKAINFDLEVATRDFKDLANRITGS